MNSVRLKQKWNLH